MLGKGNFRTIPLQYSSLGAIYVFALIRLTGLEAYAREALTYVGFVVRAPLASDRSPVEASLGIMDILLLEPTLN